LGDSDLADARRGPAGATEQDSARLDSRLIGVASGKAPGRMPPPHLAGVDPYVVDVVVAPEVMFWATRSTASFESPCTAHGLAVSSPPVSMIPPAAIDLLTSTHCCRSAEEVKR